MTTAVDSSVLFAVFKGEEGCEAWIASMAERAAEGPLVACAVVWAEVGGFFDSLQELETQLELLGVGYGPIAPEAAHLAGRTFRTYRAQGGPREHLVPDFLIGAHAQLQSDGLLALDRGFYRRYFERLQVIGPAAP